MTVDRENEVYINSGILLSYTKEENSAICSIYTLTILVSERKIRKAFHLQCIKKNEIPRKI